jgi:hypothetical protein
MKIELTTLVELRPNNGMFTDPQAIQEWLSETRRAVGEVTERMEKINRGNETKVYVDFPDGNPRAIVRAVSNG